MTFRFTGTIKYRFRLSLFGHEIFAGPWQSTPVSISEPVPSESGNIALPDGFSGSIGTSANGVALSLNWEGLPLVSQTIPASGSVPIQVQPLKGVILSGTASIGA